MAKNQQKQHDTSDLLAAIDERIEFLNTLRDAVKFAFNLEDGSGDIVDHFLREEEEEKSTRRPAKPRKKRVVADGTYAPKGANNEMVLAVLRAAGTPLSIPEIHSRMKARGWTSASPNPRNLVGSTVRYMNQKGVVRKIGLDYEWIPTTGSNASVELPETVNV